MIEGLRGAAVLKELTALAQNLEKKLGLPVSVEVLQKLAETKDGYKYLTNIDGKLIEALSKKELETGVKYWADGVKNQSTNTLTLENMIQKPQILQSEIFKSETLAKALGFEKLVEVVKAELAKPVLQTTTASTTETKTTAQPPATQTQPQTLKTEEPRTQTVPPQPQAAKEEPKANMTAPSVTRLAAASTELGAKPSDAATMQTPPKETVREVAKEGVKLAEAKSKIEPQTVQEKTVFSAKEQTQTLKDTVFKEIKASLSVQIAAQKEEPKGAKTTQTESQPKIEAQKEPQATRRVSEKLSGETLRDKLIEFKHIMASIPSVPSKAELEKIKTDAQNPVLQAQKESRTVATETIAEAAKAEMMEKLLTVLTQNFEGLPQSALQEAAKKIIDTLFGKLPETDSDEAMLKILEHLEKQLEQKEAKGAAGKKTTQALSGEAAEEAVAKEADSEPKSEQATSKTDNPASKLKAQLLEELSKVGSKAEFQILSNVAMALNKEVFTFVLEDKGVLQFKKKGDKELNAKTVEFYSAFETLGPVSGEIIHWDGNTSLSLNVEFESTYNFLKENLKELSFFDHKNVSIVHGIKEIVEIKSSFLDTTG